MSLPETLLHLRRAFPLAWRMRRRYRLPQGRMDEPYFISFEPGGGLFGERWDRFDGDGVLCKGAYNPVSIAQYALFCHEQLAAGQANARRRFLAQVEFLCNAQQRDGTYRYDFPHRGYGVPAGWISGLAQGEAFSVFLRAYALARSERYLEHARAALQPFERDVCCGGVTFMRGNDVFFEEMPARPTHILNGHLSASFAVWEAVRYGLASARLAQLHDAAVQTLARWLPLYDAAGWSYYELAAQGEGARRYVPITYHQTHIALLRVYEAMTGRSDFGAVAERWQAALKRWDVRARVWEDGASWIGQNALRRVRGVPPKAWRIVAAAPAYPTDATLERNG